MSWHSSIDLPRFPPRFKSEPELGAAASSISDISKPEIALPNASVAACDRRRRENETGG